MEFEAVKYYDRWNERVVDCKVLAALASIYELEPGTGAPLEYGSISDGVFYPSKCSGKADAVIQLLPDHLGCVREPDDGEIHLKITGVLRRGAKERQDCLGNTTFAADAQGVWLMPGWHQEEKDKQLVQRWEDETRNL